MPKDIQTKFETQLPKPQKLSFEQLFHYVAGTASILGIIFAPFAITDPTSLSFIYLITLFILVVALFSYSIYNNRKKLHRYAQSVIFSHYTNHIIRDTLQNARNTPLALITVKILNAIATCFSIITGKRCRACLVELKSDYELLATARDDISSITNKKVEKKHYLQQNTDFNNLWYATNGCSRYFLCNNLIEEWKHHNYKNSSFDVIGKPEVISFFGLDKVIKWKLPYKSALVLPIRYISSFIPPVDAEENTIKKDITNWNYWGFLCLDCNSTGVFDDRFCPELGGAFADALFTLFSEYNSLIEKLDIENDQTIQQPQHENKSSKQPIK